MSCRSYVCVSAEDGRDRGGGETPKVMIGPSVGLQGGATERKEREAVAIGEVSSHQGLFSSSFLADLFPFSRRQMKIIAFFFIATAKRKKKRKS